MRASGDCDVRALRRRPPTDRPVARGTGLRPLLHRGAAPPRHLRHLPDRAAARPPARPERDHLRRLRRCPGQPHLHRLRDRGQSLRTRPVRTLRTAPQNRGGVVRPRWAEPARPGTGLPGDHRHRRSTHRTELAAQQRRRGPTDPDGFRRQQLTAAQRFLNRTLTGITRDSDRRLVHSYATWQVLRRLRATAARGDRPRTYTHHARTNINAAVDLLNWLADHGTTLADTGQADIDTYLAGQPPSRYRVRDFLQWAAATGHAGPVAIATPGRNPGPATDHDERWAQIARLLHDGTIELTDRVAGALLLLYGQHLARIVAITHDQIKTQGPQVFLRLGTDDLHIPEPLAELIQALARDGRNYTGVGTPSTTRWLFPGLQPGRPLTAARLGDRLRKLGIRAQPGRRAALTHLAAQLPAAVIADLLGIHPTTAVHWVHDAGGDWNRYAAQLTQDASHQP